MDEDLERKIEEKIEEKAERIIEGEEKDSKLAELIQQKTQEIVQNNSQKENNSDSSQGLDTVSRRRFLKMLGFGAGGLAMASSVSAGFLSLDKTGGGSGGGAGDLATVLSNGNDIGGTDIVDGSDLVWDTSESEVPNTVVEGLKNFSRDQTFTAYPLANGDLSNSSITVSSGTGLSGGGTVSLGSSTTLSIASTLSGVSSISNTGSVSIDIDSDNNSSSQTFSLTQDGGATTLLTANEGGPIEITNANLSLGQQLEAASDNFNIKTNGTGTGMVQIRDQANSQDLLVANEGGPISVKNVTISLPSFTSDPAASAGEMWYRSDLD